MAIHVTRRVSELGEKLVLAPERYDPRRQIEVSSVRRLADYADVVTDNVSAQSAHMSSSVLILDTTHAFEGFVILRHEPVSPAEIGSAKRRLMAGDVIVSRLRPYLRQIAYVDDTLFHLAHGGNEVVASTEFFVIRGRAGFPSAGLVPFLLSEPVQRALSAGQEGGHHPRFSKDLLMSLPVPDFVAEEVGRTSSEITSNATSLRNALLACRKVVKRVGDEIADQVLTTERHSQTAPISRKA